VLKEILKLTSETKPKTQKLEEILKLTSEKQTQDSEAQRDSEADF